MHSLRGHLILAAGLIVLQPLMRAADSEWSATSGMRSRPLTPTGGPAGFVIIPPEISGVWFTNQLTGDFSLTNVVAHNGAGLAIGDINGDDWPDLYFCSLQGPNRLFLNRGNWRFEEGSIGAAACREQLSTGAVLADVDGDDDLDLLVNGIAAGTRLFLNDGRGSLTEVINSGLSRTASATSMALADVDGDGDLDLYCTHYIDTSYLADPTTRFALARDSGGAWRVARVNGQPANRPPWKDRFVVLPDDRVRELPEVDGFYLNNGGGRFARVESEPGRFTDRDGAAIQPPREWGLSIMFRDLNGDRAPDFYVCNDNASPDRIWLNTGDGHFKPPAPHAFRHASRSSMGLDFADLNRDGHDDLVVVDMLARDHSRRMRQLVRDIPDPAANEDPDETPRYNRNTLFFGRADGSFTEAAFMAGVAATDWSWGVIFIDVDLDGYEDLLVTNGFEYDVMDQDSHDQIRTTRLTYDQQKRIRRFHPAWRTRNAAFRNRGDGTFEPAGDAWGFNRPGISYGMALGDLDRDGDLDVVVNNLNDVPSLYRNECAAPRIAVRLKGVPPNTRGIGARLRLTDGRVSQSQEMISGGRYLSCDEAVRVFAAPDEATPFQLEVLWRNGDRSMARVRSQTFCEIIQSPRASAPAPPPPGRETNPWFQDVSDLLGHIHTEDNVNDWAAQPLLPRRLSRSGPGLAWLDVNDDHWEDLVISAAGGSRPVVFLNQMGAGFTDTPIDPPAPGDQGAIVLWPDGRGNRRLLVAESAPEHRPGQSGVVPYELGRSPAPLMRRLEEHLSTQQIRPGPIATADIDGDGDLDLFVGGRFRPGRFPEPVASTLWLNDGGALRVAAAGGVFENLGMVSGATFCDLDNDRDPDLVVALDWGPIRVFRNDRGAFEDGTAALGFADKQGLWTSVIAADFNSDGRLDLAAGNWGRNSPYELHLPGELRLFFDDINADGILEIIEAWRQGDAWLPVRSRHWVSRGIPDLPRRIQTHEAYGKATIEMILADHFPAARHVQASFLDSAVFLNRGATFECVPLPREAQIAPVFGISAGDLDGDGSEDLFLCQNFLGSGSDLSREDAGRGLWLRGHGDGTFTPAGTDSGIALHGEQRAAALCDFDHDGRVDLAVTQNNGPTKLYRNRRARRGLRVILQGSRENPSAIGAQMRLHYAGGRLGPVRTVQAGAGYWSQDSVVQVLGLAEHAAEALWIRSPEGREQTLSLEPDQWEIRVSLRDETE